MYVPTHLCAHIPFTCTHRPAPVEMPCTHTRHVCAYPLHTHTHAYACRNSVSISTRMTHTYTGWHRSPGSCWQGHLLVAPPWGGGGNLTGRVPSSGRSPGPHTGLAALPSLHHPALPRVLGRARRQSHRSRPCPPTAPSLQPARGHGVAPSSQALLGPRQPALRRPPALRPPSPCQSSLRSGRVPALSPPGSPGGGAGPPGAAGRRREAAPRSGAAGLCLCAHFGNCRFSSLANYLLGGGLKTVHTHKSPRDLNKRRWQVIFQHSPTLMRRERGRVGPRVGCGENELRQVQGPATRHPGRLMEGWATRARPASQPGAGAPRTPERPRLLRPHPPTPTAQSPSCGVRTCGEEVCSLWVCLTNRAASGREASAFRVRPEQRRATGSCVQGPPQRASPCPHGPRGICPTAGKRKTE